MNMSRFDRIIKRFESLDADRKINSSKIESLETKLTDLKVKLNGLDKKSVNYESSVIADYVIPAIALVTGGVELNHTSNIKSNVVDSRISNPGINWTAYFNETTGEQIKVFPPEVTPAFYESPWAACLLQQGVNVACAINLGLTYAELKGAKSLGEKIKKGAWLGFHGAAAVLSKYFTWAKGATSTTVGVPETYNSEPNVLVGDITFDSYLNGVIASGIALGIEGGLAYHNLSKLLRSLKDKNEINTEVNETLSEIISANRAVSKINDDIEKAYERAIMEFDVSDYNSSIAKQKTLGRLLVGRYPDLADSVYNSGGIPNIKELLSDVSKRTDFKNYVDSFGSYNTATIEDIYKLYLNIPFEGGLDVDDSIEMSGVIPSSIEDEIASKGLTYEQVLKGIKAYLMP